jgi:hypothetical protein
MLPGVVAVVYKLLRNHPLTCAASSLVVRALPCAVETCLLILGFDTTVLWWSDESPLNHLHVPTLYLVDKQ